MGDGKNVEDRRPSGAEGRRLIETSGWTWIAKGTIMRTDCGMPLLADNEGAFDNGGARVVDAAEHRLRKDQHM